MSDGAKNLSLPLADDVICSLHIGDAVLLSGIMVTGRDAAHRWLVDTFIHPQAQPPAAEQAIYTALKPVLDHGVIYHCGPVVSGLESGAFRFEAAGPTTSIREEPYQADVMRHFNLKGVIGKGGMGAATLQACRSLPAVYFHAVGGAGALIAQTVQRVLGVNKLEFGVPEALWVIEVQNLPAVVTMDAHGASLHDQVQKRSEKILQRFL